MEDDLFTYELEVVKDFYFPCIEKPHDNLTNKDLDVYEPRVCYDENEQIYAKAVILVNKKLVRLIDVTVEQWIDLKVSDHRKVGKEIMEEVIRGDDEEVLTDEELSNLEKEKVSEEKENVEIFRMEIDIFNFETPLCKEFKEFNHLLQIDMDVLTGDLPRFKTYEDYKDVWIYEWNREVLWVKEKPWLDHGISKEPIDDIDHFCMPYHFKSGHTEWPTCNSNKDGYCNRGNLPGIIQIGNMTYFQNYEWYDALEDDDLKNEALIEKAILEGSRGHENREGENFCSWLKECFGNYHELDYELMRKLEEYWWGKKEEEESSDDTWSHY
ncbi:hypothetical protein Tco_0331974 [Tanacetum coccineum]